MHTAKLYDFDLKHLDYIISYFSSKNKNLESREIDPCLDELVWFSDNLKKRLLKSESESDDYSQSLNHFLTPGIF
jgi:hypothetical protein